jgi:polyisoprenyl-teichoic acid--peptidoglycan teichoic acid transferase
LDTSLRGTELPKRVTSNRLGGRLTGGPSDATVVTAAIRRPTVAADNSGTAGTLSFVYSSMAKSSSPPSPRSGLPKWLKVSTITLLVVANLVALAVVWAVQTGNSLFAGADTEEAVVEFLDPSTGGQLTFLVVGSDTRAGLDDLTNFGSAGGARGDVVMLVRVDSSGEAQMLSIPRDLRVEIPGHGTAKINAAYAFGGPSLMVETIKSNLDVNINHYVEVDFVGFQEIIDEVGGIQLSFPYQARDVKSGLDIAAGDQVLSGGEALAFARSRSYQELQNGSWVSVEANDIGRTRRQQEVLKALVSRLKSPSSVAEAGDVASAMSRHMTIDASLADASPAALLWDFRSIITGAVDGATLPTFTENIGGTSFQIAQQPEADVMLANFKSGRPFAEEPLEIRVLNGNGTAGAAGEMSARLESLGFVVVGIGNADSSDYQETTVIVPQGSDDGETVTSTLGFGVVEFGDVDNGHDAVVIVGADAS